jgi:hypothetical protein
MSGGFREERMGGGRPSCRCALWRPLYDIPNPDASRSGTALLTKLTIIRYRLFPFLYNSLFQANPSRPIRELAAAGPQLPAV